jgi:hypothetical protein
LGIPFVPTTATELVEAVRSGVLVEGTNLDFKATLENGEKANARLAIDLAAFALQGGLIVIGVAEDAQTRRPECRPVPLAGRKEQVSQVGVSRVDPPVATIARELPTDELGNGYVVIMIPPSPDAPHQTDGKYRGRSDTTNYVLADADVRRVHAERHRLGRDIGQELERAVLRDPTPPDLRQHAHLFVVARPVVSTGPTMLQERLGGAWPDWIMEHLVRGPQLNRFSPDLPNSVVRVQRRPDGWAAVSSHFTEMRDLDDGAREDQLLELEVDEDGAVRLFCGRASDSSSTSSDRWVFEALIAGLTWRAIRAAAFIADEAVYFGNWDVGVALSARHPLARAGAAFVWS